MKIEMIKRKVSGLPVWLIAFLVNLIVAMLAICPFILRDGGYFAMSHDFSAEEITYQIFMNNAVKSGNLLWNWGIDIGSNLLESFSFYNIGSVFFWIELLFPAEMMPLAMGWMIVLKFAVAGATAAGYLKRHSGNRTLVVMASLLYAFSGFQCSSVVFFHFQDMVALFPLMLTALETLVEDKKHGRLIAACVLNVFCNYVFFIAEVIFLVLYYIFKYMAPEIRAKRYGFKHLAAPVLSCMLEGGIGVALGGVLLIPSIYGTMSNTRVTSHILGQNWLSMSTTDWLMLIKAFFTPAEAMNDYSSVVSANWMTNAAYLPLFGVFFVIAYLLKKKDWLATMLKACFVIAAVPVLNSVFMTFMPESYRRWYYMLVLLMALATVKVAEAPREYPLKKAAAIWTGIFVIYVVMTRFVKWDDAGNSIIYSEKWYYAGIVIAVLGVVLAGAVVKWLGRRRNVAFLLLAAAFSAGTLGMNIRHYQTTTDNTTLDFKTYSNAYVQNVVNYLTEIPSMLDSDVLPYRYYFDEGIGYTYYNLAMANSLPSINSFISTVHSSITEFYEQLGCGRATWTNVGPEGVRELLSARYVISIYEYTDADAGYTYTYVGTLENSNGQVMYVYENEDALPIGFTYDTYITRSQFEQLEDWERAAAMLTTLVIEDEDEDEASKCLTPFPFETYETGMWQSSMDEAIEARSEECSESFEQGDNYFESVITADTEKYAFFSVPYDECWKATVNGAEAEIININGLMAVKVEEGTNHIRFDYEYMPLKAGIVCSICGMIVLIGYLIFCKKSNVREGEKG